MEWDDHCAIEIRDILDSHSPRWKKGWRRDMGRCEKYGNW